MKIYKKCLEKYSVITATILTDRQTDRQTDRKKERTILSFFAAQNFRLFYLRARCVRGCSVDAPRSFLFRHTCILTRGVPEKAVMPHGIVKEDG